MPASALIIARPGPLRDGLHALVNTLPQLESVNVVADIDSALRENFNPGPALLLLDGDGSEGEVLRAVRRTQARWPESRTIILVSSVEQQDHAEAAGADAVVLQGFQPGRLVAAVLELLPPGVSR
jgi:DNA-binding NarL/FixJ family response regulator